ncbi:hypothetical protein ASF29_17900 [Rhizobium sp. Leaf262]|nr:hypothetical protein ASF29_17900 [Rhizobium sp. Leaf262]
MFFLLFAEIQSRVCTKLQRGFCFVPFDNDSNQSYLLITIRRFCIEPVCRHVCMVQTGKQASFHYRDSMA